jgi:hypothetical protein
MRAGLPLRNIRSHPARPAPAGKPGKTPFFPKLGLKPWRQTSMTLEGRTGGIVGSLKAADLRRNTGLTSNQTALATAQSGKLGKRR